jgi:hypothetical protein
MAIQNDNKKIVVNNHIVDMITPIGIKFEPSTFWFGDQIARILLITQYPPRVKVGWLSRIANMEGVICSIHLDPAEPGKLIERISRSMGELAARLNAPGSHLTLQRTEQQYKDAEILLKKIDQEQENVFYTTVAIMVMANDKEELERKSKRIEAIVAGSKMKARKAMFEQESGLLAVSPYNECPQEIKDIASRNMPMSTIAGSFPFSTSGLNDGRGFIFGKDNAGGIILLDDWKRGGDRTNSNWTILGDPGVGKSTAIKHILGNEYAQGSKIIIIDPEREYKEMCENVQGDWINCGGGIGGRINPLQIKDIPLDDDGDDEDGRLYQDEGKGVGALALHFQTLRTFFKLYLRGLETIDYAILEETLEELYANHGITWTTDVQDIPSEQYPLMEDLYKLIVFKLEEGQMTERKKERYEQLALLVKRAAQGADAALWNGHTTIKADSDFIVLDTFDLQQADESIKTTQYFNILTWAWNEVAKNRKEKVILAIDESYLIIDPEVPQALQYTRNISKRIRKYEGGLCVISHSAVDFLDPSVKRFGQALLDNPCYKFFMGTDGKNLKELTELMDLTEAEQEMLAKKKRGHGLLIAGSKRLHAIVELADHEYALFGKGGGR